MAEFPWEEFLIKLREYVSQDPLTEHYAARNALPKPSTLSLMADSYQNEHFGDMDVGDDFSTQINFAAQEALQKISAGSQSGSTHLPCPCDLEPNAC